MTDDVDEHAIDHATASAVGSVQWDGGTLQVADVEELHGISFHCSCGDSFEDPDRAADHVGRRSE